MEYRALGRTGINVSSLCLGTDNFADPTPEKECALILDKALDVGIIKRGFLSQNFTMREDAVQVSGVETEVDAEEGHQGHARDHCAWGFLGAESAIDVEKSVERNAGVDEHPG
mgnify:CR=1 FL=1